MDKALLDLIVGIKSARHEDFEALKVRYSPLINDMSDSFAASGAGAKEDLREEAQRALLKAALSFDTQKEGITFGLYAKICIRNALISVKRAKVANERKKNRIDNKRVANSLRAKISLEGIDTDEMLDRIESGLSSYELQVFKEYFSGRSAKETAEILGTDERSVNNAVYRIRAKSKKLVKEAQKDSM
ncbi:MAG: hypothetical protein IKA58_00585 [Clostridia bacterium]|nr:hypothetical protein [Clostridia bacterium]